MRIDWWTLALQTINLLVLLWILGRFLFRPMARIVAERQAEAARLLDEATARRKDAEAATEAAENEHRATLAARAGLLEKARAEAEAQRAALIAGARDEAARLRAEAQSSIARMREGEEQRIGHRAGLLATDIAAQLLGQAPGSIPLAGFEQALAALPEAARASIGAGDAPVAVNVAASPDAGEEAAIADAVERAVGRKVALAVRVDPALIAGLRLEVPDAVVRNDLRADLERIEKELNRHDAV